MTISTFDDLVAGLTASDHQHFSRLTVAQGAAGFWHSLWKFNGYPGGATANPATGAGAVPTKDTAGALAYVNAAGGTQKYLAALSCFATQRGTIVLYDRLVHTAGLDGTVSTAQTVGSTAITRPDANGANVELWLEIYTATGGTARTVTASYTNQAGTAGQTTASINFLATPVAGRMLQLPLAAGDTGVRAVASVTLSGTTGTAGNFGVTLLRRVGQIDIPNTNTSYSKNPFDLALPSLSDATCLALMYIADSGTSASLYGDMAFAEK